MPLVALALMLAACGGGGGGPAATPPPPPTGTPAPATPSPSPAPTPTPTPSGNFDDSEYRNSAANVAAEALTAYQAGATGRGIKLAVIDGDINGSHPELAGRFDPASRNLNGRDGHGTAVAAIAAGARNGSGGMGVAFDATILGLGLRAGPSGAYSIAELADEIDYAVANGARVINLSLVGDTTRPELIEAVARAGAAGVITVFAAGNGGGSQPNGFALLPAQQLGDPGLMIIAGAHAADGRVISDRAGEARDFYVAALGGSTSAATPVVAGAVALLAQAFPNLTGAQIRTLLLTSATDAGAAGIDGEYGHGRLNIARAFAPRGQTSLALGEVPVAPDRPSGALAPAMGDAGGSVSTVVLDSLGRAYRADLGRSLGLAADNHGFASALLGRQSTAAMALGTGTLSLTVADRPGEQRFAAAVGPRAAIASRPLGGSLQLRPSGRLTLTLGTAPAAAPSSRFLAAAGPSDTMRSGFDTGFGIAARQQMGRIGVTLAADKGEVALPRLAGPAPARFETTAMIADMPIGPVQLRAGWSRLDEQRTTLGGWFAPALTSSGARSDFADLAAEWSVDGWRLAASYRRGWTAIGGSGGLVDSGRLTSDGFAIDLSRGDLSLRLSQPLRVTGGGFALRGIDSYDVMTGVAVLRRDQLNLAPSGRELAVEGAYALGPLSLHAFARREPGHIESAAPDLGAAARFRLTF